MRSKIINKLQDLLKTIDGTGSWKSNLYTNVSNRMLFPDTISDFPYVCISAGKEVREYLPDNFKWGYLYVTIRIYVQNEDDTVAELEPILEDIETLLDANNNITYDGVKDTVEISISTITTDEGLLVPLGIGEIQLMIRYDIT